MQLASIMGIVWKVSFSSPNLEKETDIDIGKKYDKTAQERKEIKPPEGVLRSTLKKNQHENRGMKHLRLPNNNWSNFAKRTIEESEKGDQRRQRFLDDESNTQNDDDGDDDSGVVNEHGDMAHEIAFQKPATNEGRGKKDDMTVEEKERIRLMEHERSFRAPLRDGKREKLRDEDNDSEEAEKIRLMGHEMAMKPPALGGEEKHHVEEDSQSGEEENIMLQRLDAFEKARISNPNPLQKQYTDTSIEHISKATNNDQQSVEVVEKADRFYHFSDENPYEFTLPLPIDNVQRNFVVSVWVFLKAEPRNNRRSRTILTTKSLSSNCDEMLEPDSNSEKGGISLVVNHDGTEDEALVLEYMTGNGCMSVESLGVVVPLAKWTHVGVSYQDFSFRIFINGEIVGEVEKERDDVDDEEVQPVRVASKSQTTTIGQAMEWVNPLNGHLAMMAICAYNDEDKMKKKNPCVSQLYSAGLNSDSLIMILRNSNSKIDSQLSYLYSFESTTPTNELINTRNASLNNYRPIITS